VEPAVEKEASGNQNDPRDHPQQNDCSKRSQPWHGSVSKRCHEGVIFEQWHLLQHSIAFHFSIALKQCLHFSGLQACHSSIHCVILASVKASFPIVGAWLGLLTVDRLKDGAPFQPRCLL
jgi:hypothetical protein